MWLPLFSSVSKKFIATNKKIHEYMYIKTDKESGFIHANHLPKLHPANIARKQLVGRQTCPMVLLAVLDVSGPVPVTLPALITDERFVYGPQASHVLESGVLLQQPYRGKGSHADGTSVDFFPEQRRMH